ncbi:MAG: GTPase, partial [Verrucomicrobiota bacterium]|nr:GTPase [Verrucomicrobiota bacterium]
MVAIVGRPNVGKSALFNRIARRRIAIVHDRPGVTRDRLSAEVEWQGRPFMLVDTGGIGLLKGEQGGDDFAQEIVTQVQVALDDVDVILFVVSVHEGILPMDLEVAGMLREAGKPVLLIINKVDTVGHDKGVDEFSELGFEYMFPVSALHDRGVDTPLGQAVGLLPKPLAKPVESGDEEDQAEAEPPMNIAIVGRPNVGKSSIINALTESQRVIVSEISGTTRDAIDVPFEVETDGVRQQYNLIDTAG